MDRPKPACDGSEPYVFVTYAHADAALVYPEIRWLQDHGFPVWWDEGISPGAAWRDELARAIRGCSLLVYFVTPSSAASEQCIREVSFGLDEHRRPLLPVHLVETRLPDALSLSLSHRQAILRHKLEPEDYERKLLATVASHLDRPAPAPAARLPSPSRAAARGRRRASVFGAAGLLLAATAGYLLGTRAGDTPTEVAPAPVVRSTVELHPDAPLVIGGPAPLVGFHSTSLALSPDGRHLAYVGVTADGTQRLYLRALSDHGFEPVQGSEGAIFPFFSPDSKWLGFLTDDQVKRAPVSGGSALTVANSRTPIFATWGEDNRIYVAERQGLALARVTPDGVREELLPIEEAAADTWLADILPGGELLKVSRRDAVQSTGITIEDREAGIVERLIEAGYGARYLPSGHIVFGRAGNLFVAPFSAETRTLTGEPVLMTSGVAMDSLFGQVQAAYAASGSMAYAAGGDLAVASLSWFDGDGNEEALPLEPGLYNVFALTPDERRIAIQVSGVEDHILVYDLQSERGRKLPLDHHAGWPIWSPAGDRLLLSMFDGSDWILGEIGADGSGGFVEHDRHAGIWSSFSHWSDQGVLFYQVWAVGIRALVGEAREPVALLDEANAWGAHPSPDGRWFVYTSQRTGRSEVWLRGFPDGTVDVPVTDAGGLEPMWCPGCGEIFYRNGSRFYAVPIETEPELEIGRPRLAFEIPGFVDTGGHSYTVSRDGRRLLVLRRVNEPEVTKIHLVQNLFTELERLAPGAE